MLLANFLLDNFLLSKVVRNQQNTSIFLSYQIHIISLYITDVRSPPSLYYYEVVHFIFILVIELRAENIYNIFDYIGMLHEQCFLFPYDIALICYQEVIYFHS
nr:MAG TPA: hypothetical protein [Caudoviricetes sp.]